MSDVISGLKPALLWKYFSAICAIPHGSKKEAALCDWISRTAKEKGFTVRNDATGNICIAVPATPGYENAPTVILQGHIDMVCEKRAGSRHDFEHDPIVMQRDGEWIKATDTTLGADNGIGVAAALACMDDKELIHGPLELLCTIDEENGLTGAMGLDPAIISGRIMLNMDSEEDGMLYVGCAGGGALLSDLPIKYENPDGNLARKLIVSGLLGGHSGGEIHLNRGNAIKILARTLKALHDSIRDLKLADLHGGSAHNAIPRDAEAVITMPAVSLLQAEDILADLEARFRAEFKLDTALKLSLEAVNAPAKVFSDDSAGRAVQMLLGFHSGVFAMSRDISGLVETSNSLATISIREDRLHVHNSTRSSQPDALKGLLHQNQAVAMLAGAETEISDGYPGWQPNMQSPILLLQKKLYSNRYGHEPKITAIHAGLECGLIGERFSDMDMVSFGPDIRNPHSPDECVHIESVERFWLLLKDTLEAVAKGEYQKA